MLPLGPSVSAVAGHVMFRRASDSESNVTYDGILVIMLH